MVGARSAGEGGMRRGDAMGGKHGVKFRTVIWHDDPIHSNKLIVGVNIGKKWYFQVITLLMGQKRERSKEQIDGPCMSISAPKTFAMIN